MAFFTPVIRMLNEWPGFKKSQCAPSCSPEKHTKQKISFLFSSLVFR